MSRSAASPDEPAQRHRRPDGVTTATVAAVGKVTEALETLERARGALYSFHQLTGSADMKLGEAVAMLREAGHVDLAAAISEELVGRNVISGRWTFQLVEEYDDGYYNAFQSFEKQARDELLGGRRHIFEAEMKEDRRSHGRSTHTAQPADEAPADG